MRSATIVGAIAVAAALAYFMLPTAKVSQPNPEGAAGGLLADVVLPATFSDNAQIGRRAYEAKCASCHGVNAAGKDGVAPPLVHVIYEPSHHGDESFQLASANGVRSHHWRFGNMPPVDGITRADVTMIVAYIRELQRANEIN